MVSVKDLHLINGKAKLFVVFEGWDQGLLNMCVGEKRKLINPPELG